jgi:hypothetical protein
VAFSLGHGRAGNHYAPPCTPSACETSSMGIDFHLISNFLALALITLAGPAVIFILFYRRGAL